VDLAPDNGATRLRFHPDARSIIDPIEAKHAVVLAT
jgi:hypothetical protein